ncbi:MAG: ATP-binding cassette domain-containing protein [Armatimonadetes bacterium]|nr:ATP-binding cassette domain-containing protein [Armatimonadota bacterium]
MSAPIIGVEHLVKRYGSASAVEDISFTVAGGDFFGFLGPNGAGKTTTMRILATLLRPTSGSVRVAGFDIERRPQDVRRTIGFAMQEISLDNLASGYENLQLLGVLYGLSPRQARARAGELLELVGLSQVAHRWVNQYSGGMRRRLDLAGTLMHRPRILFLDEPTQGLDPRARRTLWDALREFNREGTTIFLTTHYMEEADALCRTLAIIDHGQIVRQGTPADLKAGLGGDLVTLQFAPETGLEKVSGSIRELLEPEAALSVQDHQIRLTHSRAGAMLPRLIQRLSDLGAAPVALSIAQPTLEDVFVRLVGRSILEDDTALVTGRDPFVEGWR